MQSWRKHEREVQIREAYSLLSNAIKLSIQENGPVNEWSDRNNWNHNLERNYLAPYLRVEKIYPYTSKKIWEAKNIRGNIDKTFYTGLLLKNGMRISYNNDTANGILNFLIDVNGAKGPDKYGNDVFWFAIVINDGLPANQLKSGDVTTWAQRPSPGYNSFSSNHISQLKQYCCNSSNCTCCARLIMMNHWKIPDDYPVKKW